MAQPVDPKAGDESDEQHLPPIAAAFLVTFDKRKGYTLSWEKSLDSVKLDGVVEFKCLPSGLHNVAEDLVYFVHENHAGVSAFLRADGGVEERNARMLSVGVLVPLDAGRMGKSFLYAKELKQLASTLISKDADKDALDSFWEKHKKTEDNGQSSPVNDQESEGYQKFRSLSTTTLSTSNEHPALPPHHPALALPELLRTFGPLLFPIFRAALLHKRILILGEAPVEQTCNFVYGISVMSAISRSLGKELPYFNFSKSRLQPLFNIGISDIPMLEDPDLGPWIACTTDDVLTSKPKLFDVLIILPTSSMLQKHGTRTYPKLIHSDPELSKVLPKYGRRATQRDARRFTGLTKNLQALQSGAASEVHRSSLDTTSDADSTTSSVSTIADHKEAIEPVPWSVVAYTSLVWWASAGDSRSGLIEAEELANEQDEAILRDSVNQEGITKEVAMVAYFHKLSALHVTVLSNAIKRSGIKGQHQYRDDEDTSRNDTHDGQQALLSSDNDDADVAVEVTEEDVRAMGLDVWSESDKQFISEMLWLWWEKKAVVRAGSIECCGMRLF